MLLYLQQKTSQSTILSFNLRLRVQPAIARGERLRHQLIRT
ncbi:MAG: hypothetical protein V7K32_07225 [Nostoc sp.]